MSSVQFFSLCVFGWMLFSDLFILRVYLVQIKFLSFGSLHAAQMNMHDPTDRMALPHPSKGCHLSVSA
jgi:hypothetical protein